MLQGRLCSWCVAWHAAFVLCLCQPDLAAGDLGNVGHPQHIDSGAGGRGKHGGGVPQRLRERHRSRRLGSSGGGCSGGLHAKERV